MNPENSPAALLNEQQAAKILNVSIAFLRKDRLDKCTIPYVLLGARTVRYSPPVLARVIEASAVGAQHV